MLKSEVTSNVVESDGVGVRSDSKEVSMTTVLKLETEIGSALPSGVDVTVMTALSCSIVAVLLSKPKGKALELVGVSELKKRLRDGVT